MDFVFHVDFIQPICLPSSQTFNPVDEDFVVAGWGRTLQGMLINLLLSFLCFSWFCIILARKSNIKLKLVVPFFNKQQCNDLYATAKAILTPKQLCAGGENAKDACNGDSGGPLMSRVGETWITYGIVSFGNGCGRQGWPGIYTDVSKYLPWIESNIRP